VKEWIPKLVKTVMGRKYDWSRTTYGKVTAFFERLTVFLTVNLHEDNEVRSILCSSLAPPNKTNFLCTLNLLTTSRILKIFCSARTQAVYQALRDLLDPNQQFYTKYCTMQVRMSSCIYKI